MNFKIPNLSNSYSKKGNVSIAMINEPVPVSPKHFLGIKEYFQNRP